VSPEQGFRVQGSGFRTAWYGRLARPAGWHGFAQRGRGGAALIALLVLTSSIGALAADAGAARDAVRQRLDSICEKLGPHVRVGLAVLDAHSGEPWFQRDPDRPLRPASVLKLFTTAAALVHLGPEFQFQTAAYLRDRELWVIGAGDPGLGDERLADRHGRARSAFFDDLANGLRERGVAAIDKIVLDDSIFDQQHRHPDWPEDQQQAWYQAPVGGLNYNDNCLDARVRVAGGTVDLLLQPQLPPTFFRNGLAASKDHEPVVRRVLGSDIFEFRGSAAREDELAPVSAGRPSVFFGHALRQGLASRGIEVRGEVVRRVVPPEARSAATALLTHTTALHDVLWRANNFSQNLFAECLLKSLAAYGQNGRRSGRPGTWADGVAVERAALEQLGLSLDGATLRDGSGLSHNNRVTAEQTARLLSILWRHAAREVYLESLAEPGEDGTMRRRFTQPALRGRLRGKTGTLAGVNTLAGYITRDDGVTLAFAVLTEGELAPDFFSRVCLTLVDAGVARP